MTGFPQSQRMLQSIRRRLTVRSLASRTFWVFVVLSILYAVLLTAGKLTGTFPEYFTLWSVAIVPVAALLLSVLWPGRPSHEQAARTVDREGDLKDLYLTLTCLQNSSSEYTPLVGRDAERAATKVDSRKVVPFHWEHPTLITAGTLGALFLAAYFMPTLDPFGHVAQAEEQKQVKNLLDEQVRSTRERKEALARKELDDENSAEVKEAIQKLEKSLQQSKKDQQQQNQEKLNAHQKEIGEIYRKLNSGELKPLFDKLAEVEQKLGQLGKQEDFKEWQKELQNGDAESLKQELKELQDKIAQMAKTNDPVEKSNLEKEIQKQLKQLSDFNASKVGSKDLKAALNKAMEQMKAAQQEGLSEEALAALEESLELAEQELQQLEQAARDMEALEKALAKLALAKKMNGRGELDGEGMGEGMTLEEFREMYARMMAEGSSDQEGEGQKGPGIGEGGAAEEDDSVATDFVDEKSRSAIQKGKILMSMKTKGISDAGELKPEEYQKIVGEIRQSLDDVIDQEEIPPGYVEGIKKYFDSLEKK